MLPAWHICLQHTTARSDLGWSAAAAHVLFDGDDAIVCNTVRKSACHGQRPLPAAAARVLCGRTFTLLEILLFTYDIVCREQAHQIERFELFFFYSVTLVIMFAY